MLRKNVNVVLVDHLYQGFHALNIHVLHENSDLLMKFRKEDEKNALLTEQNKRQVLFCPVTSRLLYDDAKIHATSARLYNVLENWREMKTVFRRNMLIRTGDLLILFYI